MEITEEEIELEKIIIKTDRKEDCSICLNRIGRRSIGTLPCGHSFHWHCCKKMYLDNNFNTCPLCRTVIMPPRPNPEAQNNQDGHYINCCNCRCAYVLFISVLCKFIFIIITCLLLFSFASLINNMIYLDLGYSSYLLILLSIISTSGLIILLSLKRSRDFICYKRNSNSTN